MFSKFFKKSDPIRPGPLDAGESRGFEVVEGDPETSWGLWDNALAEQDSRYSATEPGLLGQSLPPSSTSARMQRSVAGVEGFPNLDEVPTQPMGLEDRSPAQRAAEAIEVVGLFHHRIAHTIRTLWGYKECSSYINKLIMSGGDGMGHARVGFNAEAAQAMLVLADLHDQMFGEVEPERPTGFSDTFQSTLHGHR